MNKAYPPEQVVRAEYVARRVLLWALVFLLASAWLYFAPATDGKLRGVLRTEQGLTILGWLIFLTSLPLTLFSLVLAVRSLLRLPALKYDSHTLYSYVYPFRRVALADIEEVRIGDAQLQTRQGLRKLSVAVVREPEEFLERLRSTIGHRGGTESRPFHGSGPAR